MASGKKVDVEIEKAGNGIMVCLYLPREVAQAIAIPGGEDADDLHVTLAYVPGFGNRPEAVQRVVKALEWLGQDFAPIEGSIGGVGLFNASESSDGKDVLYASYNAPVLPVLRECVVNAIEHGAGLEVGRKHGFTPHITLKYQDPGEGSLETVATERFMIPMISVTSRTIGPIHIPLAGTRVLKAQPGSAAVHVSAPLGSEEDRLKKGITRTILGYLEKALALGKPSTLTVVDEEQDDLDILHSAQRLIEGMDWELHYGGLDDVEDARARAIKKLERDPEHYWKLIMGTEDLGDMAEGLSIDLGSGQSRTLGHMGFDIYPYDYATTVTDLTQGIPLPTGSCSRVVMNNSLADIDQGIIKHPRLMQEISRVLMPGGVLEHTGLGEVAHRDFTEKSIIKDEEGGPCRQVLIRNTFKEVPIMKANKAKQIVYGVVLTPDEVDLQDDFIEAEEIEKTAHDFLIESRTIGVLHIRNIKADLVESYIAPMDLEFDGGPYGPQVVKQGSWVIGARINDPKEWQKVVDGTYQGFSVGGLGLREPI